jgi:hypothetical protein
VSYNRDVENEKRHAPTDADPPTPANESRYWMLWDGG